MSASQERRNGRYDEYLPALPPIELDKIAESVPGLARLAAGAWFNTGKWGLVAGFRLSRRIAQAVRDPDTAAELARELGVGVGVVVEVGRQLAEGVALPRALALATRPLVQAEVMPEDPAAATPAVAAPRDATRERLRERGEELLLRSRDVEADAQAHPAYDRILDELSPDEARVLAHLYRAGPQPAVDVRTGGPAGMMSSRLIAPGLTMIGSRAGLRYADDVPAYLNNLFRLGLVWFSRESLSDPAPYQVLEAQPDVLEALHSVKMAKVVRRSIHLTPFGEDFCRTALASDDDPVEVPAHEAPPEK
ncbi:hypothetical protein GCM10011519_18270 [Marmoricola endophyticus]|uniref:DUF4393 domain-containing protein n=1 Tax=Marmoricola endophyticus TaxID=2040280 RepID=A0A917F2N8_9ACTN|nr:Abi-alpha family protein [Marmoricola endophyticus]GGF44796.1 hypothetical protein GCM10011519_18270 [Marmoricola endophyticus]